MLDVVVAIWIGHVQVKLRLLTSAMESCIIIFLNSCDYPLRLFGAKNISWTIPPGFSTGNFFFPAPTEGKKTGPTMFFLAQEFDGSAISCDFPVVQIPAPPNGA
jgi:hypothetical protein